MYIHRKLFWKWFTETLGLTDLHPVEMLQDQAQCILGDYVRNRYQRQPTRFGRLLLAIPLLRMIRTSTIELLFFKETVGDASVIRLLHDMYRAESLQSQTKPSDITIARLFPSQSHSQQIPVSSSLCSPVLMASDGNQVKPLAIIDEESNTTPEKNSLRSSPNTSKPIAALAAVT